MYGLCKGVGYDNDILPEGINDTDCIYSRANVGF